MTGLSSKGRGALEVIIFEENRFRGSRMFTSAEVTMGSDPGATIHLDDESLSPCHAALRFDGETCTIENYDALAGTHVNGSAIEQQTLSPTDEIQVGRFRLRINVHRADATPPPVAVRPLLRPPAPAARIAAPPALPAPARKPVFAAPVPAPPLAAVAPSRPPAPPAASVARTAGEHSPSAIRPAVAPTSAPTALAVAPSVPAPEAPPTTRPSLKSVPPAPKAPPARTSTQPIGSHVADTAVEAAPAGDLLDISTERVLGQRSSPSFPVPVHPRDNDDDDDDAFFEPTFSLFERLRDSGVAPHKTSAVEVVRFRHGCILKLHHLRRGEKLRLHGMRKPLGRCSGVGGFVFQRDALPENLAITAHGRPVDEAAWRQNADQRGRIALDPATQVLFPLASGEGILVQLVPAADPLPRSAWRPRLTKLMVALGAVSLVVHIVVFAILGLASLVRRDYIAENKEGRFARVALKEIELEPPAPPPKQERKKAKAEPTQTATAESVPRVVPRLPRTRAPAPTQAQSTATTQKLLSALGGLAGGSKPMSAVAMSNLDAVGAVRGGGFKVSGAIGRLPGDSLRLAAAGSGTGRLDTKSANDVAKNLGRVLGHAPTGQVRAQVKSKPSLMKVEGHLDRGEIQKVINAHIHELQGCFERQLVVNPNLAGKVTFEWVIGTSGAVTVVRIKASTLSSNEATSCMQGAIRRWQFPAPSGGNVTVIYPVALASSGT